MVSCIFRSICLFYARDIRVVLLPSDADAAVTVYSFCDRLCYLHVYRRVSYALTVVAGRGMSRMVFLRVSMTNRPIAAYNAALQQASRQKLNALRALNSTRFDLWRGFVVRHAVKQDQLNIQTFLKAKCFVNPRRIVVVRR